MKKSGIVVLFVSLILFPKFVQSQPAKWEPGCPLDALRIISVKNGEGVLEEAPHGGGRLSQVLIGPYFVEDLEMVPDPAKPGQEIRFNLRLRNGGTPVRANIRIEDKDELVARLNDISVGSGMGEFQFPDTGYVLKRLDQCFTVLVEVEGKLYKAETTRELCVKPLGCQSCRD